MERIGRVPSSAVAAVVAGGPEPVRWSRRRTIQTGSIAAGVAAVIGGTAIWNLSHSGSYATGIGQVREVVLNDGSVVTLNTNSAITVRYTEERREIRLTKGEAQFDVAKNKKRPFVVLAGNTTVRAVGTSFVVSMLPQRPIQVLVKEGVVELDHIASLKVMPARVSANKRVLASHDVPFIAVDVPKAKIERETAWRLGRIALDNQSLQDASEVFARYSDIRIVVDPAISNRTVTGLFVANDPVAFARSAAAVLDLQVEVADGQVKLFDKSGPAKVGKS